MKVVIDPRNGIEASFQRLELVVHRGVPILDGFVDVKADHRAVVAEVLLLRQSERHAGRIAS